MATPARSPANPPARPCSLAPAPPPAGPNEAGEDHLRFKVERLMEGVDAVLYILDWSKLKTK